MSNDDDPAVVSGQMLVRCNDAPLFGCAFALVLSPIEVRLWITAEGVRQTPPIVNRRPDVLAFLAEITARLSAGL